MLTKNILNITFFITLVLFASVYAHSHTRSKKTHEGKPKKIVGFLNNFFLYRVKMELTNEPRKKQEHTKAFPPTNDPRWCVVPHP